MIKILLVDDESPQRMYMRKIINWHEHGCIIVGEASNGNEALDQVARLKPDVIFLDVDMPTMNGLDFLAQLNEQKVSIKTVMVSGHNKFDYACQAMSHGAKLYLLKPIDKQELQHVLEEIIALIEEELAKKHQLDHLHHQLDETLPLLKHQLLQQLTRGDEECQWDHNDNLALLEIHPDSHDLFTVIMEVDDSIGSHQSMQSDLNIHHILKEASTIYLSHYTYDSYMDDIHGFTLIMDVSVNDMDQLIERLNKIIIYVHDKIGRSLTISCSSRYTLQTLHQAHEESIHLLQHKPFLGSNQVLRYDNCQLMHQPYMALNHQYKNQLTAYLTCKDSPQLLALIQHIYNHYASSQSSMTDIRMISSELVTIGVTYLSSLGYAPSQVFGEHYHPLLALMDYKSLEGICQHMIRFYTSIHRFTKGIEKPKLNGVIISAMTFIENNYNDPGLSLENMATDLYVHPVYLSSLFKKSVHRTISRYLLDIRMEKAMDMIRCNNKATIGEVATLTGYENPYYFSKVFKKYYGTSPTEIRKYKTIG